MIDQLFQNNKTWADKMLKEDPDFFDRLAHQQNPKYLWIGCSDSRVPANQITGLNPGEVFVHRNIANIVVHTDLNCLSVIQYAVDVLNVDDIIVCGHYGCGGVRATLDNSRLGLIDNWLRHIKDVEEKHASELKKIDNVDKRAERLCELNIIEQVVNVCETTVLKDAWKAGKTVSVHGWVYSIKNGLIKNLLVRTKNI